MNFFWQNAVYFFLASTLSGCGFLEWPARPGPLSQYGSKALENIEKNLISARQILTVRAALGDTVYKLARRHGVSVRNIIDANRLRVPYRLRTGQTLILPSVPEYVVKRGDTLYGISQRYSVGMFAMARTNELREPYLIRVGQSLKIPQWGTRKQTSRSTIVTPARKSAVITRSQSSAALKKTNMPPTVRMPVIPLPPPGARSSSGFVWPVRGKIISRFGAKAKGLHNDGINIATHRGVSVRAAENGVVAYAGNELRGFGNLLLVKHSSGWVTAYAHNEILLVKRGQIIKRGQLIARVGSSGTVNTPQLHFELRRGKQAVDPQKYLLKQKALAWVENLSTI